MARKLKIMENEKHPLDDLKNAYNDNYKHCLGIIGTGNRNFAGIYIFTAKELSAKYQIPLLYDFEFNGTPADVAAVEKLATQLDKGAKVTFKNPL